MIKFVAFLCFKNQIIKQKSLNFPFLCKNLRNLVNFEEILAEFAEIYKKCVILRFYL